MESQNLVDTLLDQRILDCAVLKEPSEGFFLDQMLISPASPDAVQWLRERQCHHFAGCRVVLYEVAAMDELMEDYQGGRWDDQGYTYHCGIGHKRSRLRSNYESAHACSSLSYQELATPRAPVVSEQSHLSLSGQVYERRATEALA